MVSPSQPSRRLRAKVTSASRTDCSWRWDLRIEGSGLGAGGSFPRDLEGLMEIGAVFGDEEVEGLAPGGDHPGQERPFSMKSESEMTRTMRTRHLPIRKMKEPIRSCPVAPVLPWEIDIGPGS